ncbi:DUF4907 domain-containing protein [Larkinella terrae]|nr:DUF4907 domain-containing protein [Larkinella terrae]
MKNNRLRPIATLLAGLVLITVYSLFFRKPDYELQTMSTGSGWGYQIVHNGKTVINQPTVPGQPGQHGFPTEVLARKVGERVVSKLRQGQFPPTLNPAELSQLGVSVQ